MVTVTIETFSTPKLATIKIKNFHFLHKIQTSFSLKFYLRLYYILLTRILDTFLLNYILVHISHGHFAHRKEHNS